MQELNAKLTPLVVFFLLLTLFVSQLAVAADASVKITLSIQVQEVLKKASPARKERLKKAIWLGNKLFMQLLDYSAYEDSVEWLKRTGVLLAMKPEEFHQMVSKWGNNYSYLQVCRGVGLVDLREAPNGEVYIAYQVTRIGVLTFDTEKESHDHAHFDHRMKGGLHLTELRINANNKVADIVPQDKLTPELYSISKSELKSSGLRRSFYQDDTPARVQARATSYDQAIIEMDQVAAEVCESTSSNIDITTKEK